MQVYEQSYEHLVQLAGLIVGDPASAEEVVRDGFVQLYRSWGRVERPASYARSAVVRASCQNGRGRSGRERRLPADPDAPDEPGATTTRHALRTLDCRERAAIALRYFEELPEIEVAEALGRRPATVRSLLARSLARLSAVSTLDTRERLQRGLRSSVDALGPITRPSLGELLAGERWERPSIKTLASLVADQARHTGRRWWSGRDRTGWQPPA